MAVMKRSGTGGRERSGAPHLSSGQRLGVGEHAPVKTVCVRSVSGAGRAVLARVLKPLIAPGGPVAERAALSVTREDLVAYVARYLERLHVPGASLALVEGDQIVQLQGFGHA